MFAYSLKMTPCSLFFRAKRPRTQKGVLGQMGLDACSGIQRGQEPRACQSAIRAAYPIVPIEMRSPPAGANQVFCLWYIKPRSKAVYPGPRPCIMTSTIVDEKPFYLARPLECRKQISLRSWLASINMSLGGSDNVVAGRPWYIQPRGA
jgi:hypothetical protein